PLYAYSSAVIRPPPTLPSFPYTTLFRSPDRQPCGGVREISWHARARLGTDPRRRTRRGGWRPPRPAGRAVPRERRGERPLAPLRDRKSTRLNSSHGSISYAVFCLKKKRT